MSRLVPRQSVGPNGEGASPWVAPPQVQAPPPQASQAPAGTAMAQPQSQPVAPPPPPIPGLVRLHPEGGLMRPAEGAPYVPPPYVVVAGPPPPHTAAAQQEIVGVVPSPWSAGGTVPAASPAPPPNPHSPQVFRDQVAIDDGKTFDGKTSWEVRGTRWAEVARMIAKQGASPEDLEILAVLLAVCSEQSWTLDELRGTLQRAL